MNKIIDLTDFYVTESDNGETYVVLKKDFDTVGNAGEFERIIENAVQEQAEKGVFKRCQVFNHPFAYLPLIKVKAQDFWEAYDEDGDLIDEDCEPDVIEQLVAVCEISLYRPASLQIKITIGITPEELEMREKEEITITCVE